MSTASSSDPLIAVSTRTHLHVDLTQPNTRLDILVENTGRLNFTTAIRGERAGITNQVTLAGKPLPGWQIYSLPMNDPEKHPLPANSLHRPLLLSRHASRSITPATRFLIPASSSKGLSG